jgi:hypothetical protein
MDFPEHKWVLVPVRNFRVLGFAYVDSMAGPSIKGRGIRDPITPEQIARVINQPNATVRVVEGIPIEVLTDEAVRQLGLPPKPDWYLDFYEKG